jgi:benzoylformate decarboxylase
MRGKHVLMDTLDAHGVDVMFGNPGTTESPLVDALVDRPRPRYILALHEAVRWAPPITTRRPAARPAW